MSQQESKVKNLNAVNSKELLINNSQFKVVCFALEVGGEIPKHSHEASAFIQVVNGVVEISFDNGDNYLLNQGDILPFDAKIKHQVMAKEESKIIVTIVNN